MKRTIFRKKPSYYNSDAWEMSVRSLVHFYQTEGFLNVQIQEPQIKLYKNKKIADVTIIISEGEAVKVSSVSFSKTPSKVSENLIYDTEGKTLKLLIRPDSRFRDENIWNDRDQITKYMVEKGYAYSYIEPIIKVDTFLNQASINWDLSPGPPCVFGDITIEGNERTPTQLIYRQLTFSKGEQYSRVKLNRSQQQVYQLGTFRIASLKAQLSLDEKDTIPVHINIKEAPIISTRFGVGYGREDRFRTFVNLQFLNFTGGARRLNLFAKHSGLEPYRIEATLTQPAAFSPNSVLALSPYIKRIKEPGFNLLNYGANLTLMQKINDQLSASFDVYYQKVNLDTASIAIFDKDVEPLKTYSKNGISTGFIYDSSTPRFNPNIGWTLAFNSRFNNFIFPGNYPFIKLQLEIKNYLPLFDFCTLGSKTKIGTINYIRKGSFIPVEERFFSGGSRSVRGWARQQLGPKDQDNIPMGGNYIFELSIEPRVKIIGPLSWVIFFDAGNVWQKKDEISANKIRFSAGSGIRFETPIGPIGIDVARPVWDDSSHWQFHLNIGHAF